MLTITHPHLVKEWNYAKNGDLLSQHVTYGMEKKVWWTCQKGHEFESTIKTRSRGGKCPYCSGKKVSKDNCLAVVNPELTKEWNEKRNLNLTPYEVTKGSSKKVWWICSKGHEWESTILKRSHGRGCPYCKGKKVSVENCLATLNPKLAAEWHPTKNKSLTASDVTHCSGKEVWWKCSKGHEWKSSISQRSYHHECPFCRKENSCLAVVNSKLAREWHPTKNKPLTPFDVTVSAKENVWWVCQEGHEWRNSINNRTYGQGCPYCKGKKVSEDNCLATVNPELAKEWNSNRNGELTPFDVVQASNKKVWWICQKNHEWQSSVSNRSQGKGCPYCSGRRVSKDNCLAVVDPILAAEWHPTKNGELSPFDVTKAGKKKVWWKCSEGHEWESILYNRARGHGCPYCSNNKVHDGNCLATVSPQLLKEFHSDKNGEITPYNITAKSNKKVWWKCEYGHEWQTTPNARTISRTGCPYCNSKTSFPEQFLYYCIKQVFKDTKNRYKVNNDGKLYEADIFIPQLRLAIEYDGFYHLYKSGIDDEKGKVFNKKGIKLVRVRWNELEKHQVSSDYQLFHDGKNGTLVEILKELTNYIVKNFVIKSEVVIQLEKLKEITLEEVENKVLASFIRRKSSNSIKNTHPHLVKEWDYDKNTPLVPESFSSGSHKRIWWKCLKGHSWYVTISSRRNGSGCPYCSGRKATSEKNLAMLEPRLAQEWNYEKNGELQPSSVTLKSGKKVWWKCVKGHNWKEVIAKRTTDRTGCPYCSNRRTAKENSLGVLNPDLTEQWNHEKNGVLTPFDVTPGSGKMVWWICSKGHEWQTTVFYRGKKGERGRGLMCPYCKGRKVSKENNLAALRLDLAQEWNYEKNGELKPEHVTVGSDRKVWWKCQHGHEWQARIYSRQKHGCRKCAYQKMKNKQ